MESAIKTLLAQGYTVTTLSLSYDMKQGKKKLHFQFRDWQNATLENCFEKFVDLEGWFQLHDRADA